MTAGEACTLVVGLIHELRSTREQWAAEALRADRAAAAFEALAERHRRAIDEGYRRRRERERAA